MASFCIVLQLQSTLAIFQQESTELKSVMLFEWPGERLFRVDAHDHAFSMGCCEWWQRRLLWVIHLDVTKVTTSRLDGWYVCCFVSLSVWHQDWMNYGEVLQVMEPWSWLDDKSLQSCKCVTSVLINSQRCFSGLKYVQSLSYSK